MRKAIILLGVILVIQITGFCQNNPLAISANGKSTYYLISLQADSSIFSMDTLSLKKDEIHRAYPRFEFDSDSTFSFFYEMNESNQIRNVSTGELAKRTVKKSKIIEGNWKSNDEQKDIRLTLFDNLVVNYSIVEGDNFIYFIRVK